MDHSVFAGRWIQVTASKWVFALHILASIIVSMATTVVFHWSRSHEIRTQRLELVDRTGAVRGAASVDADGEAAFRLYSPDRKRVLTLTVESEGAGRVAFEEGAGVLFSLYGDGKNGSVLSLGETGADGMIVVGSLHSDMPTVGEKTSWGFEIRRHGRMRSSIAASAPPAPNEPVTICVYPEQGGAECLPVDQSRKPFRIGR
jgi:hypothetical protein